MTQRKLCESCGAGYDVAYQSCPYCASDVSTAITLYPLIFDTETYRHYHLFAAINPRTGQVHTFELFDGHPLDLIGLRNVLTTHTLVGFNSIKYDMPVITYALQGATNEQLKAASDHIIQSQIQPWQFYRDFNLIEPTSIDHIDLIEVAPGQASLKAYMGKMHSRKLQDLPYHPEEVIDAPKRASLKEYCNNDLAGTVELWDTFQEQIALREQMGAEYNIELRSKSDAQIAEAVMRSIVPFKVKAPTIPAGTQFNYQPPDWLKFSTPYLQRILTRMVTEPFVVTPTSSVSASYANRLVDWGSDQVRLNPHGQWSKKPAGFSHELVQIGNTCYAMGTGGLHSTEACVTWRADLQRSLRLPDVNSYYPSLILRTGIYPAQIGPLFYTNYNKSYDERLHAKNRMSELKTELRKLKKMLGNDNTKRIAEIERELTTCKSESDGKKIQLNGTFGKLGSKWSIFFTPAGLLQVTMTGQLALLMLIEALELAGITVVSANTDGIVIFADRSLDWFADSIIQWWESVTGFTMETTEFKLLAARDVNSYLSITADNELKLKGAFAPPEPGASGWPNPTGQICVDAMVAFLRDGTPIANTIRACQDIKQFVYVRTVKGGGSYCPVQVLPKTTTLTAMRAALGVTTTGNNPEIRAQYELLRQHRISQTEYLGKVVRWAYITDSQGCILTPEGNLVPRTTGCRPLMTLPDTMPVDIDYDWYVREAESLLKDVGL